MSQDKIEQTFTVTSPARLKLSNIRGSVEIHTGEEGVISVTAIKQSHTGDAEQTKIEVSQDADGTVVATTKFGEGSWQWLFGSKPCEVDYVVKAPRQCSLKVNGVSSEASVEGFEGEFEFNSVSGDLALNNLTGPVKINTVSGDVSGSHLAGPLDLKTVSGDVSLTESSLPTINANTVSGDLDLRTPLADGPYHFKSVSGDVRLTAAPETRCTVELHGVSGDFSTAFPVSRSSHGHGSLTADVQGGGVKVCLNTVSGDLSLESSGEIPPAPAFSGASSAVDRRAILERIERGEMSVEEGLSQLKV